MHSNASSNLRDMPSALGKRIPQDEADALAVALTSPSFDDSDIRAPVELVRRLSPTLAASISDYRQSCEGPGFLLLQGLPIDHALCDTPANLRKPGVQLAPLAERVLLSAASLLGEIVSYEGEWEGALIHDVCPIQAHEASRSSMGCSQPLDLHTELINLIPLDPHYVCLICNRTDANFDGSTQLLTLDALLGGLPAAVADALREPEFSVAPPYSFADSAVSPPISIISGEGPSQRLALELQGMRPLTGSARAAWSAVEQLCLSEAMLQVHLQPGDLLLMDNRRVAHGRTGFPARFDGRDRWLMRVLVRDNLWPKSASTDGSGRILKKNPAPSDSMLSSGTSNINALSVAPHEERY